MSCVTLSEVLARPENRPPQRALVLAPHPDDFDVIAVTLRAFRDAGHELHLAVLTSGASGVEDAFCLPQPPTFEVKRALRELEQRASCTRFGLAPARIAFLRLDEDADGHLAESEANAARVERHLATVQPDHVFLPHGDDTNIDHQRVYRLTRRLAATSRRRMTAWYNRDPKTVAMRYDVLTAYGAADAAWKAELLRCHQSQHQRNLRTRGHGLDDRILSVDVDTAQKSASGLPYAEAFEVEAFVPIIQSGGQL